MFDTLIIVYSFEIKSIIEGVQFPDDSMPCTVTMGLSTFGVTRRIELQYNLGPDVLYNYLEMRSTTRGVFRYSRDLELVVQLLCNCSVTQRTHKRWTKTATVQPNGAILMASLI